MTLHVTVTARDIECGQGCDPDCCPIKIALARASGDPDATVFSTYCVVHGHRRALPPEALAFVDDFDNGYPVQPFAFDLDVPDLILEEVRS